MKAPTTPDPTEPSPRPPWWLGEAVVATMVISISYVPLPEMDERTRHPVMIWLVLAAIAILPWRRRWPLTVLTGCIALYAAAAALGTAAQGIALAIAIAMYSTAYRMRRPWTLRVGSACVGLVVVVTVIAATGNLLDPRVVQIALMVGLGTALGDAARSRRDFLVAAQERVTRAEQTREAEAQRRVTEERLRIARDLHDTVAHQISVISLNAGVASSVLANDPDKARQALGTVRRASRTVLGEIGDLLTWLRANEPASEAGRPQPSLVELPQLIAHFTDSGMDVHLVTDGDTVQLPEAIDPVAYRVIQEGLTNAHRHGTGRRADVRLTIRTDQVEIEITNPVPAAPNPKHADQFAGGYGLSGLRERAAAVRGTIVAGAVGNGYRLLATLPLSKDTAS